MSDHVKLYLAARYHVGACEVEQGNVHCALASTEPYPYHLESFHYAQNEDSHTVANKRNDKLFMDSGAFSMFASGVKVDLDKYVRYLALRAGCIELASNLDAIGAGKEKESYGNQKYLEAAKLSVPVHPVHHARDDDSWLVKYLDEGYPYILLGGMVPETTNYLYDWLDHIWDKYLALPDGTARVKIHGFGLTTFELMERYPWYSVDSTSWMMTGRFGAITMNINGKPRSLSFSSKSPQVKEIDKSYWSLDAVTQAHVRAEIEAEGFTAEQLAESYGARWKWNIRFYRRYMDGLAPLFQRRHVTLF